MWVKVPPLWEEADADSAHTAIDYQVKLGSHRGIRDFGNKSHCPLVGYYGQRTVKHP